MNDTISPTGDTAGHPVTPAGWYPDGTGVMRWWDGFQWTEHVAPMPETAAVQEIHQPQQFSTDFLQATYQAEGASTPPKPRNKLVIPLIAAGALVVVGALVGTGFIVSNALTTPPSPDLSLDPLHEDNTQAPEPDVSDEDDSPLGGFADVLAELDQFFKDQQLPLDGSLLAAVTPEQKQFVEQMRLEYEASGAGWSENDESFVLALTGDACETSILNGHDIDDFMVRTHAMSSPLITQVTTGLSEADRVSTTDAVMRIVVVGTGYMCSADSPQWAESYDSINGAW